MALPSPSPSLTAALLTLLSACAGTTPPMHADATESTTHDTDTSIDDGSSTREPGTSSTTSTTTAASTTAADTGSEASSDSTSDPNSGTTGPAQSICGDGIIDPDETCDDMNDDPDDGCKLCTRDRIVFASSLIHQGFALDGLFGADQRCRMLAALAMLPNFGTYRAWLSDSTTSAADRMIHSRGRYILVNGLVVADDWDALVSKSLQNAIEVTESSESAFGICRWTGTLSNGQPAVGNSFCNDWDDGKANQWGASGLGDELAGSWSFWEHGPCGGECAIYCFEN